MSRIDFTKMQGLGNDFVVLEGPRSLSAQDVAELCDRRRGIGADGVLVVTKGPPVYMEYWNADGSAAEMCGNGLRCVARYAYDRGWSAGTQFTVTTPIGDRSVRVLDDRVEVELGRPSLDGQREIRGTSYQLVDMGNPHAVSFVDDPQMIDVAGIGASLQPEFPNGANIEFARVDKGQIEMRVWERGVGETLACGTGMAAVAAVTAQQFDLESPIPVNAPGGRAAVDLRDGVAWLIGPADYSFTGSVEER